jgi:hypothetical protein
METRKKENRFMKIIKLIIFWILQWTWGLPQNLLGLFFTLKMKRHPKEMFNGALVTWHDENWGGISLGMFLIICGNKSPLWKKDTLTHEYGHAIQSIILGPLYLFVIGIPSYIWCNGKKYIELRKNKDISYYEFYPEKWANKLGEKFTGYKISDKAK